MSKQWVPALVIWMFLAVSLSFAVAAPPNPDVLKELDDIEKCIAGNANPEVKDALRKFAKSRMDALQADLLRALSIKLPLTCPLTDDEETRAKEFVRDAPNTLAGDNAKAALAQHAKMLVEMANENQAIIALKRIEPKIDSMIPGIAFLQKCPGFPELEMTLPLQSGNPVIISSFPRLTTAIPWLSGNQDFTNYAAGLDANKIQLLKALAVKFRGTRAERFVTAVLNETVRLDAIEAFAACQRKMNLRPPVIIAIEDQEAWRQFNYANQLFDTQAIDALAVVIESFPGTPLLMQQLVRFNVSHQSLKLGNSNARWTTSGRKRRANSSMRITSRVPSAVWCRENSRPA